MTLTAGCPLEFADGTTASDFTGNPGTSVDPYEGFTGGDDTGGPDDSGDASSTITVGGDTAGVTSLADELTVEFPNCEEPLEAAFWRSEIIRLVNIERAAVGIDPVRHNQTLEDQACQYACELIYYDFFGHVNHVTHTTLADRSGEFGYDYWIVGENLAAGQRTPAEAVADWMDSPCHRENILNPAFTELGVGVRYGGDYDYYWVQEFGRPFSADPYGRSSLRGSGVRSQRLSGLLGGLLSER